MPHIHEDYDYTASAMIRRGEKMLFLMHNKHKLWLQAGGHIELDELPLDALFREIAEETGLNRDDLSFIVERPPLRKQGSVEFELPDVMNHHPINATHSHIDFMYFLECKPGAEVQFDPNEHSGAKWFTAEEIRTLDATQMHDYTKNVALDVLDL